MATFSTTNTMLSSSQTCLLAPTRISGLKLVSFSRSGRSNLPLSFRRLQVSCAAKQETVEKVCWIVKKQLALNDDTSVTGDSKLAAFGTDTMDICMIMMQLEKEFGINVFVLRSVESGQDEVDRMMKRVQDGLNLMDNIESVQNAADLIENIIGKTNTA